MSKFDNRRQEWGRFAVEVLSDDDAPTIDGDQSIFDKTLSEALGNAELLAKSGDAAVFRKNTQKYEPGMVISRELSAIHAPPGKEDAVSASFVLGEATDAVTVRVEKGEVMALVYSNGDFTHIDMEARFGEDVQICPGKFIHPSLFPVVGVIALADSVDNLLKKGAKEFRRRFHAAMVGAEKMARGETSHPGFSVKKIGKVGKKRRGGGSVH